MEVNGDDNKAHLNLSVAAKYCFCEQRKTNFHH